MPKVWDKKLGQHLDHQHTVGDIANLQTQIATILGNLLIAGSSVTITQNNGKLVISASGSGFGGVTDHGELDGLADDDHTQYHNNARGDLRYSLLGHTHPSSAYDHGSLTGLSDDDHSQYHNDARGDARYSLLGHTHAASTLTGVLSIDKGGTGANTDTNARTALGLQIGADVQAYNDVLQNTTASYTTTQATKLSGIEDNADVTDAANVTTALNNASLSNISPDVGDLVLLKDDGGDLKTATIQAVLDLGGSGLSQAQVLARGLGC